ncbi:MAG TPA: transglycosylase domain-containing protein [Gaiellaceae bacterium]|nr:transglycosylase domain-containing protein [Gaiellaceae bacterium]
MAGDDGRNGRGNGSGPQRRQPSRADLEFERILLARHGRLRRRNRRRRSVLLLATLLLAAVVALLLATVAFTGSQILLSTCSLTDLRPLSLGQNSFLYTDDGGQLGVVPSATNRQPLPLSKISPWLPDATVAIEDARFWQHDALDYQGIARALYQDIAHGQVVQGGSTITQELVRNLYIGSNQRTISRKIKEACLSEKLFQKEQNKYGKDARKEILSDYLNEVFYGRHAYGAEAAARTYFSKDASALTLVQAALLAGLPQAPTVYDPLTNPQAALARRNEVLQALWKNGYISAAKLRQASRKKLELRPGHRYSHVQEPNFFGWATTQLADLPHFGSRQVELGGLSATTTLDRRLQGLALHAVTTVLHTPTDPAAAVVAMDPRTGAVKAMVDYLPSGGHIQFNFATQGHRSTGSAFKPITLATALTEGDSLYSTFYGPPELNIITPECATNNGPWDVHNYADEAAGTMNLLDATANSVNTIFAQLIARVGTRNVMAMARQLGVTEPIGSQYFQQACAITLGAVGFTPLELTDVYATFADGGVHHAPQAFESIRGPTGKVIQKLSTKGTRVLTPNVAAQLTYALQGVVTHGTGAAAALGRPVAGKTGTAENFQDAWFCGYVPQLVACVWVGYPKGEIPLYNVEGVGQVAGGTLPAEIWKDFMGPAVGPLPVENFPTPDLNGGRYISGTGTYSYATSSTG